MKNKTQYICLTLLVCFIVSGYIYTLPLPRVNKLVEQDSAAVLDRNGEHIAFRNEQKQILTPLADIPITLIELILLAEDKRFFAHGGIDGIALSRAILDNLKASGSKFSGASTLSQQLTRMIYKYPRNIVGKIKVMLHSLKLDFALTKGELLENYLNYVPFSHQRHGVAAAAQFYFNKDLKSLSLSEMATMAILIQSPARLSSSSQLKVAKQEKNHLLARYFVYYPMDKWQREIHFSEEAQFTKMSKANTAWLFKQFAVKNHNLSSKDLNTTLDLNLQKVAQKIVYKKILDLKESGVTNGAALIIDNRNGDVLAYVGSYDFFDEKIGQIDAIQIPRQPGSSLKPFTYGLALENSFQMHSVLPDIPLSFESGRGIYRPRNYSLKFHGPVTMRKALGNSLNIPALYLAQQIGVPKLYDYLKSLGFTLPRESDYYGVGLTLGNAEVSLWELVRAYTAFSHKGEVLKLNYIAGSDKILTASQMKPSTPQLINNILSDNSARELSFGRHNIFNTDYHFAVKTGTSTLYRDNIAIGYNRRYTVGVWVGDMDQKQMHNISGITGAGPILRQLFDHLMQKQKVRAFELSSNYKNITLCPVSGGRSTKSCPHKIEELVETNNIKSIQDCSFHQTIKVHNCFEAHDVAAINITSYPQTFREWALSLNDFHIKDQIAKTCSSENFFYDESKIINQAEDKAIEITSPHRGSIYGVDPNIPKHLQKIPLLLKGMASINSVEWVLDQDIAIKSSGEKKYLELRKGKFEVKAVIKLNSGKTIHRETHFTVL